MVLRVRCERRSIYESFRQLAIQADDWWSVVLAAVRLNQRNTANESDQFIHSIYFAHWMRSVRIRLILYSGRRCPVTSAPLPYLLIENKNCAPASNIRQCGFYFCAETSGGDGRKLDAITCKMIQHSGVSISIHVTHLTAFTWIFQSTENTSFLRQKHIKRCFFSHLRTHYIFACL